MKKWIPTVAGLALLGSGSVAQACTINKWTTGVGLSDTDTVATSYQGVCGLGIATAANGTFVRDENPAGEASYNARFFIRLDSAAISNGVSVSVLKGYSGTVGAGTEEFDVSLVGVTGARPNVVVDGLNSAGATTPIPIPDNTTWNSIEIRWTAGSSGSITAVVNGFEAGSQSTNLTNGASVIDFVEFGSAATGDGSSGGTFTLDEFESRRTQTIGLPITGDTNLDGVVSVSDLITILANAANPVNGPADCDGNGVLSVSDLICVLSNAG